MKPNRSQLAIGQIQKVQKLIERQWPQYLGEVWEGIARESIPFLTIDKSRWKPASRWWGKGLDGREMEFDAVAESLNDEQTILVGEVKVQCSEKKSRQVESQLRSKINLCPAFQGKRVVTAIW